MAASVARRGMAARIVEETAGCGLSRRGWADVGAAFGVVGVAVDFFVNSVGILILYVPCGYRGGGRDLPGGFFLGRVVSLKILVQMTTHCVPT